MTEEVSSRLCPVCCDGMSGGGGKKGRHQGAACMYDQGGYRGLSPEVLKKGLAGLVQFPVPLFHGTLQCQPSLSTHRDLGIQAGRLAQMSHLCASDSCLALRHGRLPMSILGIQIGRWASDRRREGFAVVQASPAPCWTLDWTRWRQKVGESSPLCLRCALSCRPSLVDAQPHEAPSARANVGRMIGLTPDITYCVLWTESRRTMGGGG